MPAQAEPAGDTSPAAMAPVRAVSLKQRPLGLVAGAAGTKGLIDVYLLLRTPGAP